MDGQAMFTALGSKAQSWLGDSKNAMARVRLQERKV